MKEIEYTNNSRWSSMKFSSNDYYYDLTFFQSAGAVFYVYEGRFRNHVNTIWNIHNILNHVKEEIPEYFLEVQQFCFEHI